MAKKPIIAIDIDDVLAASSEALRLAVNQRLGVSLTTEHYRVPGEYWGYYESVWKTHGFGDQLKLHDMNPGMERDQSHVLPYENAQAVLRHLSAAYELVIVTSRDHSWKQASKAWLAAQFPKTFSKVAFTDTGPDRPQKTKGQLCEELGAQWLIDDNVEHCLSAQASGVQPLLFGTYGWHQNVPNDMLRCRDWHAVQEYFDGQR